MCAAQAIPDLLTAEMGRCKEPLVIAMVKGFEQANTDRGTVCLQEI